MYLDRYVNEVWKGRGKYACMAMEGLDWVRDTGDSEEDRLDTGSVRVG